MPAAIGRALLPVNAVGVPVGVCVFEPDAALMRVRTDGLADKLGDGDSDGEGDSLGVGVGVGVGDGEPARHEDSCRWSRSSPAPV